MKEDPFVPENSLKEKKAHQVLRETRFITVGYVGDTQFGRFDSDTERLRLLPRVLWMEQKEPENGEPETGKVQATARAFVVNLCTAFQYYNHSVDGHLLHGYDQSACDGEDYVALNEEDLGSWTTVNRTAQITLRKWEVTGGADHLRNYLEGMCLEGLRSYLEKGKEKLQHTGAFVLVGGEANHLLTPDEELIRKPPVAP
ncbi:HLA class I histocompatibility antigen, B-57 alpha chain [Galemys pyrenaicus]|uniref:HLA class I histocompatibility antigen, B-57 alpha chain n=1 Tax=Galemys pyrenaicus TaxID=202257 RepID=A0A8J6AFI9_GALPY|nr:HLA class I histocompatibility antigen, B-57 alpha chain [Galemys pyrenaicus]